MLLHGDEFQKLLPEGGGHGGVQLQPQNRQAPALFQQLLHVNPVVLLGILEFIRIKLHIGVPGHGKDAALHRGVVAVEGGGEVENQVLRADEPGAAGKHHHLGQYLRHRGKGHGGLVVLALYQGGNIQLLVAEMGGGVAAVHNLGGEHRKNLIPEYSPGVVCLLLGEGGEGDIRNALHLQAPADLPIDLLLLPHKGGGHLVDAHQLLLGGQAAFVVHLIRLHGGNVKETA